MFVGIASFDSVVNLVTSKEAESVNSLALNVNVTAVVVLSVLVPAIFTTPFAFPVVNSPIELEADTNSNLLESYFSHVPIECVSLTPTVTVTVSPLFASVLFALIDEAFTLVANATNTTIVTIPDNNFFILFISFLILIFN